MEKRNLKILFGFAMIIVLILASCRKIDKFDDLKVVNYDAEFAIPLFKARASFQDILDQFDEDTYVEIGPDDLITVFYKGDVAGRSSSDILDTIYDYLGGTTVPFPIVDSTYIAYPLDFTNSINVDIDYAVLKNTSLTYSFSDTLPEKVTVRFWIPNLTKDGQQFEIFHTTSTGPAIVLPNQYIYDLSGYKLSPESDTIKAYYEALKEDSTSIYLEYFVALINDLEFSYVEGYLGNDIFELEPDTIVIDFFGNWTRGDVYFADPKINLLINNSFGFPVRSKVNELKVFTVDGQELDIESDYLDDINVDFPSFSEIGQTKTTLFDFNKDNSNIDVILGSGPEKIYYDFDAVANPDTNEVFPGFMTDSSFMNVQVEVELPMYGTASGFEARDTFGIDFDGYKNYDDVEFKIISENGIPLDVGLQIFFADQNGTILDSLFTPQRNILEGAPVDSEGLPTMIAEKTTFTAFEGERFDKIKNAKQLFMRASFSTVNNGETMVKILSTQDVNIRMGMKIGVSN